MSKIIKTKEDLLAHIKKMLDDKRKVVEWMDGKRTRESLKKDGIILEKLG
jgi:hypothetical protein